MKITSKLILLTTALAGVALAGCNNAEYGVIDNMAFIASAPSVVTGEMAMESDAGTTMSFGVRLGDVANQDVTVTLGLDDAAVDAYNSENGTAYFTIPTGNISFLKEGEEPVSRNSGDSKTRATQGFSVVIPKGEISVSVRVHVVQMAMQTEEVHAFGVKITDVEGGGIKSSSRMSNMLFAITMPPPPPVPISTTQVLVGRGANSQIRAHAGNDWGLLLDRFTLETWCRMDNYSKNNRAIWSNDAVNADGNGGTEVYVRFGDANSPYNYFQIKAWGGQIDGPRGTNAAQIAAGGLEAGKWYHWAIVWDGSVMTIYRNGVEYLRKADLPAPPRADGKIQFATLATISSGTTYFNTNAGLSNMRFWRTARTADEIKNNMKMTVYEKDPNLIAYWPFDQWKEGTENVLEDITGNGNDMTCGDGIFQRWDTVDLGAQGQ